jgi:hypothetical protein
MTEVTNSNVVTRKAKSEGAQMAIFASQETDNVIPHRKNITLSYEPSRFNAIYRFVRMVY